MKRLRNIYFTRISRRISHQGFSLSYLSINLVENKFDEMKGISADNICFVTVDETKLLYHFQMVTFTNNFLFPYILEAL